MDSPSEKNELQEVLGDLHGPVVESSGVFTLSADKTREKMQKYGLADPGLYPVLVLAAAVAGGATRFEVHTGVGSLDFIFDGELYTRVELEGLFSHLAAGSPPRLRYLATAIEAATQVPCEVTFRSGPLLLKVKGSAVIVELSGRAPGCRLTTTTPPVPFGRFFQGVPAIIDVLSITRMAPLEMSLDGVPVKNTTQATVWIERHLLRAGQQPDQSKDPRIQQAPSPGKYWGRLALAYEAEQFGVMIIVHGIAYREDLGNLIGYVYADFLKLDFSFSQLVRDEVLDKFLGQLQEQSHSMLLEHVRSLKCLDRNSRSGLRPALKDSLLYYETRGDAQALADLNVWVDARRIALEEAVWEDARSGKDARSSLQLAETLREQINTLVYKWDSPHELARCARLLVELLPQPPRSLLATQYWAHFLLPSDSVKTPVPEAAILTARSRGCPDEALQLIESKAAGEDFRQAAECALALELFEKARDYAQAAFKATPDADWRGKMECADLLADCFELLGQPEPSVTLRISAFEIESSLCQERIQRIQVFRSRDIAGRLRASTLLTWVGWQVRAASFSIGAPSFALDKALHKHSVKQAVEALQAEPSGFELERMLTFYHMRCAQELRRAGECRAADLLLAQFQARAALYQSGLQFVRESTANLTFRFASGQADVAS